MNKPTHIRVSKQVYDVFLKLLGRHQEETFSQYVARVPRKPTSNHVNG